MSKNISNPNYKPRGQKLELMRLLARKPEMPVKTISKKLDITEDHVHVLLMECRKRGLIKKHTFYEVLQKLQRDDGTVVRRSVPPGQVVGGQAWWQIQLDEVLDYEYLKASATFAEVAAHVLPHIRRISASDLAIKTYPRWEVSFGSDDSRTVSVVGLKE